MLDAATGAVAVRISPRLSALVRIPGKKIQRGGRLCAEMRIAKSRKTAREYARPTGLAAISRPSFPKNYKMHPFERFLFAGGFVAIDCVGNPSAPTYALCASLPIPLHVPAQPLGAWQGSGSFQFLIFSFQHRGLSPKWLRDGGRGGRTGGSPGTLTGVKETALCWIECGFGGLCMVDRGWRGK
jgi:hypothetical protein